MSRDSNKYKGLLSLWVVQLVGSLPLTLNRWFGSCIGWFNYVLNTRLSQVTRINLERCYPDLSQTQRNELIKQSMLETGRVAAELPQIWVKPYSWLETKITKVENRELLDQALESETGLVLLLPHLGNWEIFGPYIARITDMTALYQPPKLAAMEGLIRQSREREGAKLVPTNNKGVMSLFKALKAGGTTIILPDQVPAEEAGEFAPFFGVPALTMTLVNGLVKRTGCRVLMGYALRVEGGFEITFEEPDPDIYSEDLQTSVAAMNSSVEHCVNVCPSQYQWEYKRFRKQPPGEPKFYG